MEKDRSIVIRARLLSLAALLAVLGAPAHGQRPDALFAPANVAADVQGPEPGVRRRRLVTVAIEQLNTAGDAARASRPTLTLNLFEDVSFLAELERTEPTPTGFVWIGRLVGVDGGRVTLAVTGGVMAGSVTTPDAEFTIAHAVNGVHAVNEIDRTQLPAEAPPLVPDQGGATAAAEPRALADDGSQIDVLVVYTPAARTARGGAAGIESLIDLGISEANQAYANGGAIQRLRLVHKEEIAYTEAGNMGTDLVRLRAPGDGYMDDVHARRDATGADVVHLIVVSWDYCGIAYIMTSVSSSFAPFAFGVTHYTCISPNGTIAHELGHNMGLAHDVYVTQASYGAYPYSRGYVNQAAFAPGAPSNKRWRDVMSYNDQCVAAGFSCARLNYFASPRTTYLGDPMGDAASADGVRTLDETRTVLANFRASLSSVSMTLTDVSVIEGNAGTTTARFRVTLSGPSTSPVQVAYATASGSAQSGGDFAATSGTLSLAPGVTQAEIAVPVVADTTAEETEHFTVVLSAPAGASIADGSATGTIRNDDFTDPALAGVFVKAIHVAELRTMINEVRAARALAPYAFSRTLTPQSTVIHAIDILEMRAAIPSACAPSAYTDPTMTAGVTPIRAVHLAEIRAAVAACL